MYPKISIITPSFNQGHYLERTVRSVLDQNYPNLEYVIIDGGSADESVGTIRRYEDRLAYWVSEADRGQSHAINKGLARVTGDIVAWIASDDWYEPGCFAEVARMYNETPENILVGDCLLHYSNSNKEVLLSPVIPTYQSLLRYWRPQFCPPQPSFFIPRLALDRIGLLNEHLHYGMDLDLWLRLSRIYEFRKVNALLSHYLIHDDSKSGLGFAKFRNEWRKISSEHLDTQSLLCKAEYYLDFYWDRINRKFRKKK